MSSSSSKICNILDVPDEILVYIILHLNARERLILADSCKRLNSLVFEDQALLRQVYSRLLLDIDLDFSKNGNLTTAANIQRYFSKETTRQFAIKVNIQNVYCMNPGQMLNNSLGRGINLVDLNIHGTEFEDIEGLGSFLTPLLHLKRLSFDWPKSGNPDITSNEGILQKPFSRLTYLSLVIRLFWLCRVFPPVVKLCLELKELRMVILSGGDLDPMPSSSESIKLKNLKVFQFRGRHSDSFIKKSLMAMVPDPAEWTDFWVVSPLEAYLEKNVEMCNELSDVRSLSWPISSITTGDLLEKAIKITHEDVPTKFCCLHDDINWGQSCVLKIDEAKKLLKDPGYQISYLHFKHTIEPDCDAHLVASAFPNVTELVFHVINSKSSTTSRCQNRKKPFKRRLRKKGSMAPEQQNDTTNPDSSFEMLIENTPRVKNLAIFSGGSEWLDLDALYLIPRWKSLRIIILTGMTFENGNILINIGKECQELQEVKLMFLSGLLDKYCYGNGLVQMLNDCRNLRKFSIEENKIDNMPEVFRALSNKPKLETVRVKTRTEKYDSLELISSIEQMLHHCPRLIKFVIAILSGSNRVDAELRPDLERIVGKLNRPNFVFLGPSPYFREDAPTSFFPSPFGR